MTNLDKSLSEPHTYDELLELVRQRDETIDRLQRLLQTHTKRMREVVTKLPLGVIVVSDQQKIEAVNPLIEDLFLYEREELLGQRVSFLFPEMTVLEIVPKSVQVVAKRKGGETFPVEIFTTEQERSIFVHVLDITERQRLENLRQDFVAMVSHDLRTPLTSIRAFLTMVDEGVYGEINKQGHNAVERAQSSADLLISLVVDLLDAQKIESGDFEPDFQETTTGMVVDRAIFASQGSAKSADVELEKDVVNDVFWADEDRIVQVLVNLIGNAIKFSPAKGSIKVTAGLEGAGVVFRVKDQGPGIPKHLQAAVFERYRQLAQPKDTKKRGVGLGLSICKKLVEKHKGTIWVESVEGKGSSFCISIPLQDEKFKR